MSTYEPGTVAVATVRGVKGVRVFRRDIGGVTRDWAHDSRTVRFSCSNDEDVTDIRPLVVLDLDEIATPEENCGDPAAPEVVSCLRNAAKAAGGWRATVAYRIADQIEAQVKPPRIPEPGLYAVVSTEDENGLTTYHWRSHDCWHAEDGRVREWDDLTDPTLIREGVQS